MVPSDRMPFGKYKGIPISKIPISYLEFMMPKLKGGDFSELGLLFEEILNSPKLRQEQKTADLDQAATDFLKDHGCGDMKPIKPTFKLKGKTRRRF